MTLLIVARYVYPVDFSLVEHDLRILREYSVRLGPIIVLVQSPDTRAHRWREDGIVVEYIPQRGTGLVNLLWFWALGAWRAYGAVRRHGVRVVDASDLAGAFVLLPVRWLTGVRFLLQLQFQFFDMPTGIYPRWKRWAFRVGATAACRAADSVRCVAKHIRDQAIRAGVDPAKLVVIPTRCDTDLFNRATAPHPPAARGRPLIYVGSLSYVKGVDVLLAALPLVRRRVSDARLVIVGDGPGRQALQEDAARRGLQDGVEFVGRVPHSRLPSLLASAELFVLPSRSEAMPRAVLEAMAMALPVVGSAVGGIREAVRDKIDGLLVPPEDPAALAAAIVELLDNPGRVTEMGRNGRRRVLKHYAFEPNVQALVEWHRAAGAQA